MEGVPKKVKARMFSGVDKLSIGKNSHMGISSMSLDISTNSGPRTEIACPSTALERWASLVVKLTESKECSIWALWERAGILPKFARNSLNKVETEYGIRIRADDRKNYYSKFCNRAVGNTTLTSIELEQLLGPDEMGIAASIDEARSEIQQLLAILNSSFDTEVEYETDRLDFEFFVSVICEIKKKAVKPADSSANPSKLILPRQFPIDPDSSTKQMWDIFCLLLLLYCSFSVPYSIAFLDDSSSLGVVDIFGLVVDMVFMCDIALSFVTAIEVDGIVVRDLRVISATYCRLSISPCLCLRSSIQAGYRENRIFNLSLQVVPPFSLIPKQNLPPSSFPPSLPLHISFPFSRPSCVRCVALPSPLLSSPSPPLRPRPPLPLPCH